MRFDFAPVAIPAADEALRGGIRNFLSTALDHIPVHRRARTWLGVDLAFSRALGAAGFIGLTLPKEYGGKGLGNFARFVVLEELLTAGAPIGAHSTADRQTAPLLLKFGTEAQRREHIPAICRGERIFSIGMSEPGAGSDLASVKTKATLLDSGQWSLNGAKTWTTNAQHAHYMIVLARTSGEPADRNRGLSQLLVDMSLPGIEVRPIIDIAGDAHFCEVRFDNVILDADALLGTEGEGWSQVTAELAFERSGPDRIMSTAILLDLWTARIATRPISPEALQVLGRLTAELSVLRALSLSLMASLERGESPVVEASLVKDLGTSFEQKIPALLLDLFEFDAADEADAELRRVLVYLAQMAPSFSLRGGTREILRGIIARGLGLR